jgi:hypothetical protein
MNKIINAAPNAPEKNDLLPVPFILNVTKRRRVKKWPKPFGGICTLIDSREKLLSLAGPFDHTYSQFFKNDHTRCAENFGRANVFVLDVDNTHALNPEEWVGEGDIIDAWEYIREITLSECARLNIQGAKIPTDITPYLVPSGYNMKPKLVLDKNDNPKKDGNGNIMYHAPRPKFHIYIVLAVTIADGKIFDALIKGVIAELNKRCKFQFPLFDPSCSSCANLIFGNTVEGSAAIPLDTTRRIAGKIFGEKITNIVCTPAAFDVENDERAEAAPPVQRAPGGAGIIPQGCRRPTLIKEGGRILRECNGDAEKARPLFDALAEKCVPRLSHKVLDEIFEWLVSTFRPAAPSASKTEWKMMEFIMLYLDNMPEFLKLPQPEPTGTRGDVLWAAYWYGATLKLPGGLGSDRADTIFGFLQRTIDKHFDAAREKSKNISKARNKSEAEKKAEKAFLGLPEVQRLKAEYSHGGGS